MTRFFQVLAMLFMISHAVLSQSDGKHRVIVLTDIEADPDDTQSLVRLILYSNEIDIKGLIATTSCWHKSSVDPESIKKVIQAYADVRPNLLKHSASYPDSEELLSVVKKSLPKYGMQVVGQDKDSEGSNWIIKELEKDDDRPLWISIWGGSNALAQALFKIERTKSKKETERLVSKLRVYAISDQDDSGIWLRHHFPELFYIVSPGDDYGRATWNCIYTQVDNIDNTTVSNEWLVQNVQQGHGALGVAYPDVAVGMEGDTPAFLSLIPNGLNVAEHPEWGGWGGRYALHIPELNDRREGNSGVPYEPETRKIWTDAIDSYTPYVANSYGPPWKRDSVSFRDNKVTLWRWRDDFQNDFAARMDWCVAAYEEANHPPEVIVNHPKPITVESGGYFSLQARDSSDPDGDHLSFLWFNYPEAGTYAEEVSVLSPTQSNTLVIAPKVAEEVFLHFIVKVTDAGIPPLSRYERVIVSVLPEKD